MESKAHLRDFRMAPRKVALVADLVTIVTASEVIGMD